MKHLRHGLAVAGMDGLRCDLVKRNQYEGSPGEPRMRNFESCLAETEVTQHQDIQVQCTRAVGDACGAVASEVELNGEQCIEQGTRGTIGFEGDHCIEESGLVSVADGPGRVEPGAGGNAAQGGETVRGGDEGGCGRSGETAEV